MTIANTTIKIKSSEVTGNVPVSLANGELAINSADGKLFYADPDGDILSLSNQFTFGTINANSSLIVASTPEDTLSLIAGDNIRINSDPLNKSITITATASGVFTDGNFSGDVTADELIANTAVYVGGNTAITSTSFTTDSTSQVTVDSFPIASYRSAKYEVQITSGSSYHVIELRLLHDGTTCYMAQYGEMYTASSLGTFDASVTSGTLSLLFNPANATTTVRIYRNALVT